MDLPNIIGYAGTGLIICMQILTQFGIYNSCSFKILPLSIVSSLCLIYSLCYHHNEPVLIAQAVLLFIAVVGLLRLSYYHWRGLL